MRPLRPASPATSPSVESSSATGAVCDQAAVRRRETRLAQRAQSIDRSWQRELRATKTFDEVAAADPPRLLHRAQHGIETGEPAWPSFADDCLTGEHAVALQEDACL